MGNEPKLLEELLEKLATFGPERDQAALVMRLKAAVPGADPSIVALAVETYVARAVAPEKLGQWASAGFFSSSLLQQATRSAIAEHHAEAFRGLEHVVEIGTGIGSDTAELARVCGHITTIDSDSVASDLARRNLALRGITNVTFLVGDALSVVSSLVRPIDGLFADPARRTKAGVRVKSGDDYSPPLSRLLELSIGRVRALKISPGLFVDPPPGWCREFIGHGDECLEQTLWFGTSKVDSSVYLADEKVSWSPASAPFVCERAASLDGYLVEPHGAVNRSKHVDQFFAQHNVKMLDPDVSYGVTASAPSQSPLMTSFRIIKSFPFQPKHLRSQLTKLGWSNRTELKKRNFQGDLEQIRTSLKLPQHSHGAAFGVVFLFRWAGRPWCVLGERMS